MNTGRLSLSLFFSSALMLCGPILAGEQSALDGESLLIIESDTYESGEKQSQSTANKSRPFAAGNMMAKFEYSEDVVCNPIAAKVYSEREIYSILLALSDSGAKTARPFAESKDNIDKGARQTASRMIDLQEEESARIREIMLEERMDFDSSVNGFANQVAADISPQRFDGAIGRNILPFAARHHAIVIAFALEALELSDDDDARELAYDLIVDHSEALAEVKEFQQEK